MMYVDETRCAGCGACLQVCLTNAIRLVNDGAQIDAALCNDCRACVEVCPSDAIIAALPVHTPTIPITSVQVKTESADLHLTQVLETKQLTERSRAIPPIVGATLAFLGREIAPRVASAIVETILKHSEEKPSSPLAQNIRLGRQRRLRQRMRGTER